jgi:diadenosine tetraphosphate (Ap4A) HIT family hydrolase
MTDPSSPFLDIAQSDWLASNELCFAIADRYPVSPGHALVVPRRLVATWWEATAEEQHALLDLAAEIRELLEDHHRPDGWNLGVNVGEAGGQTVPHLHLHLIPRYIGDVAEPRGGIRNVIPGRGVWRDQDETPAHDDRSAP